MEKDKYYVCRLSFEPDAKTDFKKPFQIYSEAKKYVDNFAKPCQCWIILKKIEGKYRIIRRYRYY